MLGYKKKRLFADSKKISLEFDGFYVFAEGGKKGLRAVDSLNCDCRDGCLRTGLGIAQYKTKSGVSPSISQFLSPIDGVFSIDTVSSLAAATYGEEMYAVTEDGKLWLYSESSKRFLGGAFVGVGASAATAYNKQTDKRQTIVSGSNRSLLVYDGGTHGIALPNTTKAICEHNNRIFIGSMVFKVVYSSPDKAFTFTPDTTDEYGTLNLPLDRGDVEALLPFEDVVYIFCSRGIFRLRPDELARNFKLETVEYDGGGIFGKTVGSCGDAIFFLAQDGLYRMRGEHVKRVCGHLPIHPQKSNQLCNHGVAEGNFLVRYLDVDGERRTLAVDAEGKDGYFMSNFEGLSEHNGKTLCRYLERVGTPMSEGNLPSGEEYYFLSEKLDFGKKGRKTLTALKFEGTGGFACEVYVDGRTFSQSLSFHDGVALWDKPLRGREFQLRFSLSKGAEIRRLTVEAVSL